MLKPMIWWIGVAGIVPLLGQSPAGSPAEPTGLRDIVDLLNTPIMAASRMPQSSREAPATVVTVTEAQIRRRGYRSLFDVLADLPEFKVEKGVDEHYYSNVSVRGVAGVDKFILMMDGIRITGPTNEPLPILENYPVHFAKQIEIIYGPSSALYGADAVVGIINIITRTPETAMEGTLEVGEDGRRFANLFCAQRVLPNVHLRVAGQVSQDDQPSMDRYYSDYRGFSAQRSGLFPTYYGPKVPSLPYASDPSYPVSASALYFSIQFPQVALNYFINQSRFPSSLKNTPDNAIYSEDQFVGHRLQVLSLSHELKEEAWELASRWSYSDYILNPNSNYRDALGDFLPAYKYAQSSSFRMDESLLVKLNSRTKLNMGVVFESFDALPWSANLNQPVDPNGTTQGTLLGSTLAADFFRVHYQNLGCFVQGLFQPAQGLSITLGTRWDHNSRYGATLNPRVGVVYSPDANWTFKALYGSSFLAPSPYETFMHYGKFTTTDGGATYHSTFWRLPNPDLQPIKSDTLEGSIQRLFGASWNVTLSLYVMQLRNLFAVVPDSTYTHLYNGYYKGWPVDTIMVQTNLGQQTNRGGSLQLNHISYPAGTRMEGYASLSYVDGHVDTLGNGQSVEIERIAPWQFKTGVEWEVGEWTISPRLIWISTQRVSQLDPSSQERYTLPGYRVVHLHVKRGWTLPKGRLSAYLTAENLFDTRYRNANYEAQPGPNYAFFGVPQDPRRLSAGISYRY